MQMIAPMITPSLWIVRHATRLPAGRPLLDLACGGGRHVRYLADGNRPILAVDRDSAALVALAGLPGVETLVADLEGDDWPLAGRTFGGIVVTNYLWRPRLDAVLAALEPGGVLLYETFMLGNEAYGKPSNPEFLLRPGELRERCAAAGLREIEFVEGYVASPKPAMRQAICAVRD